MIQRQVSFVEAIKSGFSHYVDFNGRASRSEYWWWALFTFIITGAATPVSQTVSGIAGLILFLPGIALGVRRLHDIGKSGWAYLINLIPVIGNIIFIIWACRESQPGENEYGPVPNTIDS